MKESEEHPKSVREEALLRVPEAFWARTSAHEEEATSILRCLDFDPALRPSFNDIVSVLQK